MTREELLEKRRAGFEAWAANYHLSVKRISRDGRYLHQETTDAFLGWNAALDSVEIELPDTCNCCYDAEDTLDAVRTCIESAGLKVKA